MAPKWMLRAPKWMLRAPKWMLRHLLVDVGHVDGALADFLLRLRLRQEGGVHRDDGGLRGEHLVGGTSQQNMLISSEWPAQTVHIQNGNERDYSEHARLR
eukprot:5274067-Pyramimonas_sp.AAC.1